LVLHGSLRFPLEFLWIRKGILQIPFRCP